MDPFIVCDNVTKSFRRDGAVTEAVGGVSFTIEEGSFVAVVGPSGCGKSTLLMSLAGLTTPTTGAVRVGENQLAGPYASMGIAFQHAELLDWRNTLGNVMLQAEIRGLPRREYEGRARELLAKVGLGGFEESMPRELSGGMQQRVSLCRALLHDPDLLIMDEPFGALDALTRDQIQIDLQKLWMGTRKTVVFVTHNIGEAVFLADRILVFSNRPSTLLKDVPVPLPRPRRIRDRGDPAFAAIVADVMDVFGQMGVIHED